MQNVLSAYIKLFGLIMLIIIPISSFKISMHYFSLGILFSVLCALFTVAFYYGLLLLLIYLCKLLKRRSYFKEREYISVLISSISLIPSLFIFKISWELAFIAATAIFIFIAYFYLLSSFLLYKFSPLPNINKLKVRRDLKGLINALSCNKDQSIRDAAL